MPDVTEGRCRTLQLLALLALIPRAEVAKGKYSIAVKHPRGGAAFWREGAGWRCSRRRHELFVTFADIDQLLQQLWPMDDDEADAFVRGELPEPTADDLDEIARLVELVTPKGGADGQ